MKKLLGILVLGLLWCNINVADESELYIEVEKATQETDILKINKEYRLKCEETQDDIGVIFNSNVIKSNVLKSEAVMNFGEEGEIYIKYTQKISSSGKISKAKVKAHFSPDFNKDMKKVMKSLLDEFKDSMGADYLPTELYGETLKPIAIEDKKKIKEMKNAMQRLAKIPGMESLKDIIKDFQKLKIRGYRKYLGTSVIQSEKFYVVKGFATFESEDEKVLEEYLDAFGGNSLTVYMLIHTASGFAVIMDGQKYPICTIYKQDKEIVTIDTSDIF